jgi:hypothetical protein
MRAEQDIFLQTTTKLIAENSTKSNEVGRRGGFHIRPQYQSCEMIMNKGSVVYASFFRLFGWGEALFY